jgi:hypothetical protein
VHGGGTDLFLAYLQRRKADRIAAKARQQQLIVEMEQPAGLPIKDANAARAELIMLDILSELDVVIRDLWRFCRHPGEETKQLPKLHAALRSGRGKRALDVARAKKQWAACELWLKAYNTMQKSMQYRSDRSIAKEIATTLKLDWRTVLRYWQQYKQPWGNPESWEQNHAAEITKYADMHRISRLEAVKVMFQNPNVKWAAEIINRAKSRQRGAVPKKRKQGARARVTVRRRFT